METMVKHKIGWFNWGQPFGLLINKYKDTEKLVAIKKWKKTVKALENQNETPGANYKLPSPIINTYISKTWKKSSQILQRLLPWKSKVLVHSVAWLIGSSLSTFYCHWGRMALSNYCDFCECHLLHFEFTNWFLVNTRNFNLITFFW